MKCILMIFYEPVLLFVFFLSNFVSSSRMIWKSIVNNVFLTVFSYLPTTSGEYSDIWEIMK